MLQAGRGHQGSGVPQRLGVSRVGSEAVCLLLIGRLGVQSFGGAQLAGRTLAEAFTQPILRLDLDRMDDNDNRLFGITAQIAWMPKPSYQVTLRTPLYAVRN